MSEMEVKSYELKMQRNQKLIEIKDTKNKISIDFITFNSEVLASGEQVFVLPPQAPCYLELEIEIREIIVCHTIGIN